MESSWGPSLVLHFSQLPHWLFCDNLFNPYWRLVDRNSLAILSILTCRALVAYLSANLQFIFFLYVTVDFMDFLGDKDHNLYFQMFLIEPKPMKSCYSSGVGGIDTSHLFVSVLPSVSAFISSWSLKINYLSESCFIILPLVPLHFSLSAFSIWYFYIILPITRDLDPSSLAHHAKVIVIFPLGNSSLAGRG